ncbi:hypothetical protein SAMN05421770_102267 [Granulicella rosea]|uniref:Uncharacterized protein n=1 Tax=Granulicella rosea TaxID=474952 RepID=A0A239H8N1_9BACT|nr:hypothetical protein [Granulicella rosea]SNS77398.1 hypothetical protein SAMN05421770_102267 [Granulicella rosea]
MNKCLRLLPLLAALPSFAQDLQIPRITPHITLPAPTPAPREPTNPPARDVRDPRAGIQFHLPAGWNTSRTDGELSTFRTDARTAPAATRFSMVAALGFNPYPSSTFASALVYVSTTPRVTPEACAAQATAAPAQPAPKTMVAGQPFDRGHDEYGKICTEARDDIFTAMHAGTCVRFDLAINTFCGGEVSGARDMTERELENIHLRMESILATVKFAGSK